MWSLLISLLACESLSLPDDLDGDGFTVAAGDCNDADPTIYPGAAEDEEYDTGPGGDGIDDDCDGFIDNGTVHFDDDGDGACEVAPCVDGGPAGDCDDTNDTVFPNAAELEDRLDNDCDGVVDEGTDAYDDDGDGYTEHDGDCDDVRSAIHPGATEECDDIDNDCDDAIDEDFDTDEEGFLTAEVVGCGADLSDSDSTIYPGAPELCDGLDNDQDGRVDEDFDADEDGWVSTAESACTVWLTSPLVSGDCDDSNPLIHPEAVEVCDDIDNNCSGYVDEEEQDEDTRDDMDVDGDGAICEEDPGDCEGDDDRNVYRNEDADGIDNDCDGVVQEDTLDDDGDGWANWLDCDDTSASTYPGATEQCDGVDNDCDNIIDDETGADCAAH